MTTDDQIVAYNKNSQVQTAKGVRPMHSTSRYLVGDIGATYTRFAPAVAHGIGKLSVSETENHASIQAAIEGYMKTTHQRFDTLALAVAGPVLDDTVTCTNAGWIFSRKDLESSFGFQKILLLNDCEAAAMALPSITKDLEPELIEDEQQPHGPGRNLRKIGGGQHVPTGRMAVISPGTGLGVASVIQVANGQWLAIPGEGGHVTMPATCREENEILDLLRLRWGHVSAERVLSGAGLVSLYHCLCALHGAKAQPFTTPEEITKAAFETKPANLLCVGAFRTFCAMLGTIASNLALTLGTTGGLFLTGGILRKYHDELNNSPFRQRFEQKGRLSDYMQKIPTYLVLHQAPALQGLVNMLAQQAIPL